jgi:hypothetical protein
MDVWSLQQGASRLGPSGYRPKADRPVLRAHMRALRRKRLITERATTQICALAADLLQARRGR